MCNQSEREKVDSAILEEALAGLALQHRAKLSTLNLELKEDESKVRGTFERERVSGLKRGPWNNLICDETTNLGHQQASLGKIGGDSSKAQHAVTVWGLVSILIAQILDACGLNVYKHNGPFLIY